MKTKAQVLQKYKISFNVTICFDLPCIKGGAGVGLIWSTLAEGHSFLNKVQTTMYIQIKLGPAEQDTL